MTASGRFAGGNYQTAGPGSISNASDLPDAAWSACCDKSMYKVCIYKLLQRYYLL